VIFAFIPQKNIYLCSNSIDKLTRLAILSWEELWLKANKFSFMESIIMYVVEIIFYSLLSLFIDKYKSSGLSFFDFIKSFFVKVPRDVNYKNNEIRYNEITENIIEGFQRHFQELSSYNKSQKDNHECLQLVNICKNFDTLKAVDNFNGELFGNEIFCLLGHNGAGKTTLVNMITGIYDPSHGDIFYKGRSIVTDKQFLFENIGVCQQEDIFFEYLTVSEHLEYMCKIKGSTIDAKEISDLIVQIGLAEKSSSLCSTLSGGQKRKLCTALALIGNSNIIILDEPTSGMDPSSKRSLWDFLKNYQRNKIILITTHSLDEAEYLGDRIGIMSDGQLVCCGTSSYLKSKYPCGLNINLLINSEKFNEDKKKKQFLKE
jgi:ATP-binding cassette subfamily A (ABC1) protein 3